MTVRRWVEEFEDMSDLFKLSDLQKFIFAKRLICGRAKMFLDGEKNVKTWSKIRQTLVKEFAEETNSADLHSALGSARQGSNEPVIDYYFRMKEIASRGSIEDSAIIQYIINGINDLDVNKHILYGCGNIHEFRDKLKVYEKIKDNSRRNEVKKDFKAGFKNVVRQETIRDAKFLSEKPKTYLNRNQKYTQPVANTRQRSDSNSKIICYNCNEEGHKSSVCKFKEKGLRCFRCDEFGHKANVCPQKNVNRVTTSHHRPNKIQKCVEVLGKQLDAIWDSGSEITIVNQEAYVELGSPKLTQNNVQLMGISSDQISPLGYFATSIMIDDYCVYTDIYVLSSLCNKMVIGMDVMSQIDFSMSNEGVNISGLRKNFQVNYVCIAPSKRSDNEISPEPKPRTRFITSIRKLVYPRQPVVPECEGNKVESCESQKSEASVLNSDENDSPVEASMIETHKVFVHLTDLVASDNVDLSHILNHDTRAELKNLIQNYVPMKTKNVDVSMHIILKDEIPVCSSPRRLPITEKLKVQEQCDEWLKTGIIQKSTSEFTSPVVLCKKKDGSSRLCIDFRRLNKKIVRDHFPLPLIEDVLDKLGSAKIYTTLDLKNGFFHVDVDEKSRKYTSFVTHDSQYEFLKVPFGLTNSPSVFQRYIFNIFRDLMKDNTVIVFMDDLVIPSIDEEEGIAKLKRVMKTASEYGLELNFKKCQFLKNEIEFLGHRVKSGRIYPSNLKTKAVQNFPEPKCTKDVQAYLGLTGFFRKFILNYSLIAKPLTDLLKKDRKFHFGTEETNSFNKLKKILSEEPVLSIYDPKRETEIHTDASIDGYGAILLQRSIDGELHPVYYHSRKTSEAERKLSSYELEVLAVIEALKKFRIYVLGIPFKIVTDCSAFQMTMSKKDISTKIARWALMLEDYDYSLEHRSGTKMRHVDALSRNTVLVVTRSADGLTSKIAAAQEEDEEIKTIKTLIEKREDDTHLIKNGVLYKYKEGRELLVIPEALQIDVIKEIHKKGHFAAAKTEEVLSQNFYIPKARKKIESVISNCVDCILCNRKRGKGEGFLNPIPKEAIPLSTYHIDFLGPLPTTNKKYQHLFTVIDAFTKFIWIYPVKTTSSKEAIEKLKFQENIFGNPSRIISDRGSAFTGKEFQEYCDERSIEHIKITTGIPRSNGQIERLHNTLIPVLSKLSLEDPMKWYKHVADVQRIINSTTSRSTKYSPFELMTGVRMRNPEDLRIKELLESEYLDDFNAERERLREDAKKNISIIQRQNQLQYDRKRRTAKKYDVGDTVAIQRTQFGAGLKLKSKFLGPYRVAKVKPNDRYDLEKIGCHEGPIKTSSAADHMKPWSNDL